jgi:mannosyltransferase OCH1-like enzyme
MIPKIIHQIWIGNKPAPTKFMDTWRDKNPEFKYMRWNEKEINNHAAIFSCRNRVYEIEEINGKADILRWEILYEYGGVFLDADSICIEPIDDILMNTSCFAGWEQEQVRPGLIATGTMGFPPKHPLVKKAIEWIKNNPVSRAETGKQAWQTVGPMLLTSMYNSNQEFQNEMKIFPSYTFLPIHCTGIEYTEHGKIYAFQEWGSTKNNYDIMNSITLPSNFFPPDKNNSVSILVSSYNTKAIYIKECLNSIRSQIGYFNIELVWINDGSDYTNTLLLKNLLNQFEKTTRFIKIVYIENEVNKGLGYSLNKGVNLCTNEIIMRMDSDDIMFPNRLQKQIEFMKNNKNCVLSGAQIEMFKMVNGNKVNMGKTNHPNLDLQTFKKNTSQHWLMNHPTFCFRKSGILSVGNYNNNIHSMCEDFELILRVLKKYGNIMNIQEPLLYYRLHEDQLTFNGGKEGSVYWNKIRNNLISTII